MIIDYETCRQRLDLLNVHIKMESFDDIPDVVLNIHYIIEQIQAKREGLC